MSTSKLQWFYLFQCIVILIDIFMKISAEKENTTIDCKEDRSTECKKGRTEYDYGFVAFLFSSKDASQECTGAIIAASWILNYCEYTGEYNYDTVRVGVPITIFKGRAILEDYKLDRRVSYPGHNVTRFPQIYEKYDLQLLYAATHSFFLDHTETEMQLRIGVVRPIALTQTSKLPKEARTIFFTKGSRKSKKVYYRMLPILNSTACNNYYKKYNLTLQPEVQYCVNSSTVTFLECCGSHAVMEVNNRLIGVVAWSTACFSTPEPWVFTTMGTYYQWITNITNDDPLFPPGRKEFLHNFTKEGEKFTISPDEHNFTREVTEIARLEQNHTFTKNITGEKTIINHTFTKNINRKMKIIKHG